MKECFGLGLPDDPRKERLLVLFPRDWICHNETLHTPYKQMVLPSVCFRATMDIYICDSKPKASKSTLIVLEGLKMFLRNPGIAHLLALCSFSIETYVLCEKFWKFINIG